MAERTKVCPQCQGTMKECGCGTGKCDHCVNGFIVDYPLGQKRYVPEYLKPESVSALAQYWSDYTRVDNLGQFIQRVAAQAVTEYRDMLHEISGDPYTLSDYVCNENAPVEEQALDRNLAYEQRELKDSDGEA